MTNPFYSSTSAIARFTKARAEVVKGEFDRVQAGFDLVQDYVNTSLAPANYRATFLEALADFSVGTYFTCAETGTLRVYKRTAGVPGYVDQGDGVAPVTRGLLAASTALGLIGAPETNLYDKLYKRSALSILRGGCKLFARTRQQCLDMAADLTEMRGFAKLAGTTGGAGKTPILVWNDSDDVNTTGSLRWAVAQAKANGGGIIYGSEKGYHTVRMRSRILIDFENVTIAFPGRNWRFGALNDVEMFRVAARNVIIRDVPTFRYPHYSAIDNQFLTYSAANSNLTAGQTAFAISFPFFDSSSIVVRKNTFDILVENRDYTISGGGGPSGSTGTLTLTSAVSASDEIRIFGKLYQADGISVRPEVADMVWIDRCTATDHTDGAIDISSALVDINVPATALVAGVRYQITTVGTTNWTAIGAASNTVGTIFVATGPGTGTGVAQSAPCRVTVSRCYIRRQLEAMAIGSSATSAQTPPPAWAATALAQTPIVNVTLDRNVFEGASQRCPRVGALAYVHSVNNVHIMSAYRRDDGTTAAQYAAWATTGGKIYSEGDYLMRAGTDVPANGMYASTAAWDATTRLGPGAITFSGTVAETGISLVAANAGSVPLPPYTLVADAVPASNRFDYVRSRFAQAGAEISPLSEMSYVFVDKATGDAQGLWPDGIDVVQADNGYYVRTDTATPSTGDNPVDTVVAGSISFPRGSTLVLVSNAITLRSGQAFNAIDTEGAAASDVLSTINPPTGTTLPDGFIWGCRSASNSRVITVTSAGNIDLPNGPMILDSTSKMLWLRWGASMSKWGVISSNARSEGDLVPSPVGVTNVASTTGTRLFWEREAGSNFVKVHFSILVTPTANGALTDVALPLPWPSDLAVGNDLIGSGGFGAGATLTPVIVFGDSVNNRATIRFTSNTTSSGAAIGSFRYKVL